GCFFFRPKAWEHSARGNAPGRRSTIWFSTLKGSDKPPSTTCESVMSLGFARRMRQPVAQRRRRHVGDDPDKPDQNGSQHGELRGFVAQALGQVGGEELLNDE